MNAIVLGGDTGALVAAHYLVRAGCQALVLDAHGTHDTGAFDAGWIPARIVRELDLERHGLAIEHADPWGAVVLPEGGRLELWRDPARSAEAIRRLSARDAERWPEFCARMARLARFLESVYLAPPPDIMAADFRARLRLGALSLRTRRLGRQGIEDLLRVLPMSVADLLDDWFQSDALKTVLGAAGIMDLGQGPRSAGTAFRMLHHHVGSPPGVFRPPVSNLRQALRQRPGIEIRRAQVARIVVRDGRVSGVVLASGEEISADIVLADGDPKLTLLQLVAAEWLDPEARRALRNVRSRGVTAQVKLVLGGAPGFSTLMLGRCLDDLERACDDAKYGRVSRLPYLEARRIGPVAADSFRVDVQVQYAPYRLADGEWNDESRSALGDLVIGMLAECLPDFPHAVTARHVLAPPDLEQLYGFPEGQPLHAELTLDQALWMRPIPGWASYRTPIPGLYFCGPAAHPAVPAVAGYNAARTALRDCGTGQVAGPGSKTA